MIAGAGPLELGFDLWQRRGCGAVPREETMTCDGPFLQVENIADSLITITIRSEAAHLEDQFCRAVIENGHLRVGRLALVGVAEAAADGKNAAWQRGAGDGPASDVHLVNALV